MENQKFCLRWSNFQSSVTSVFDNLRQDEELVDVTLCCEGKKMKAHRMMLSACSPYFRDLFKDNPCQHPLFFLKDTSYADLAAVVEFVYKGEVNVVQSQLASFLKTAEMLQVKGLSGDDEDSPTMDTATPQSLGGAGVSSPVVFAALPTWSRPPPSPGWAPPTPERPPKRLRPSDDSHANDPEIATSGDAEPPSVSVKLEQVTPPPRVRHNAPPPRVNHEALAPQIKQEPVVDHPENEAVAGEAAGFTGFEPAPGGAQDLDRLFGRVAEYEASAPRLGPDGGGGGAGITFDENGTPGGGGGAVRRSRWTCIVCGRWYQHSVSLSQHMSVHRGHTACHLCPRVFSRVNKLNVHLESTHGVARNPRRPRNDAPPPLPPQLPAAGASPTGDVRL